MRVGCWFFHEAVRDGSFGVVIMTEDYSEMVAPAFFMFTVSALIMRP